ncbi:MAG: hypothetical protein LBD22_00940 [Spirochaetaceae bacterium]|nr:hypothetical protein [Spirochaetaceae bacterium]
MKAKVFVLGFLLSSFAAWGGEGDVSVQGFYFDTGFGVGGAWTEINGNDVSKVFGSSVDEVGVEFGLKAGYGPVGNIPLYIVGELAGIGHRLYDSSNFIQFNSYLFGGGIIYYPVSFLQFAADIGFSITANDTDIPGRMLKSKGGIAGNFSLAFDFGKNKNGFLLGLRYFYATNTLEQTNAEQNQSGLNVFIKYAYRHKAKKAEKTEEDK